MEHLQKTDERHPRRTAFAAMKERNHLLHKKNSKKGNVSKDFKICYDGNFDCL